METGLVSATFRRKGPREIMELCRRGGLCAIEWSGDVHAVSPSAARTIARDMGQLHTVSLGSYYHLQTGADFDPVLHTALALGAPNIRLWAGTQEGPAATGAYWEAAAEEAVSLARRCAREGLSISFEYHGGTLTARQEDALRLLQEAREPNLFIYWQPLDHIPEGQKLGHVQALCQTGRLLHLHVFHWVKRQRRPLKEGQSRWLPWLQAAAPYARGALLEFVKDDDPEQFLQDCAVLRQWEEQCR